MSIFTNNTLKIIVFNWGDNIGTKDIYNLDNNHKDIYVAIFIVV